MKISLLLMGKFLLVLFTSQIANGEPRFEPRTAEWEALMLAKMLSCIGESAAPWSVWTRVRVPVRFSLLPRPPTSKFGFFPSGIIFDFVFSQGDALSKSKAEREYARLYDDDDDDTDTDDDNDDDDRDDYNGRVHLNAPFRFWTIPTFFSCCVMNQMLLKSLEEQSGKKGIVETKWSCCLGSSCSTPHDKEVVGSYPAGCWAFFLFSILSVMRPWFRSLMEVQHYWFSYRIFLAMQLEAIQA